MNNEWEELGIRPADILVPAVRCRENFCVVACDQFTSDQTYWKETEKLTYGSYSALKLIYPEIYLNDEPERRIEEINRNMREYLNAGVFDAYNDSIIYAQRILSGGKVRHGLVLAVDLEKYDYSPGSGSLIRATEGTIESRLPARIKIRENAPLELPHIMLLLDDIDNTVIQPVSAEASKLIYDIPLMQGGGRVKGFLLNDNEKERIREALTALADKNAFKSRYGLKEDKPLLLYAVGDGNHSLATAKACWEHIKPGLSKSERENHPARFALAELVNLHDSSLVFEPIHRVLFNISPEKIFHDLETFCGFSEKGQAVELVFNGRAHKVHLARPRHQLGVGTLQKFLDEVLLNEKQAELDYIHEEETVRELGSRKGNIGFILSPMSKNDLFKSVIIDGPLPRKTFSMGSGKDKRYYLEARRIKP